MADLKPLEIGLAPNDSLLEASIVRADLLDLPVPAFILDNVLSREECAQYIAATEGIGYQSLEKIYPTQIRDNDRLLTSSPLDASVIFSRVLPHLRATDCYHRPVSYSGRGMWVPFGLNECFRFGRTQQGCRFQAHLDGPWVPSVRECSIYTILIYLNDQADFGGGETNFLRDSDEEKEKDDHVTDKARVLLHGITPKAGRALLFKHETLHEGAPVQFGTKYILRTEIMFRRQPSAIDAYSYCERSHVDEKSSASQHVLSGVAIEKRAEVMVDHLIGQSEKALDESDTQASYAKFAQALMLQRELTPPFNCFTFFNCLAERDEKNTIGAVVQIIESNGNSNSNANEAAGVSRLHLSVWTSRSPAMQEGVVGSLLVRIFSFLIPADLVRAMRVNQLYYRIGRAGSLWHAHFARTNERAARLLLSEPDRDRNCVLQDWFTLYYLYESHQMPALESMDDDETPNEEVMSSENRSPVIATTANESRVPNSKLLRTPKRKQPVPSRFGQAFDSTQVVCLDAGSWATKFGLVGTEECHSELASYGKYYSAYSFNTSIGNDMIYNGRGKWFQVVKFFEKRRIFNLNYVYDNSMDEKTKKLFLNNERRDDYKDHAESVAGGSSLSKQPTFDLYYKNSLVKFCNDSSLKNFFTISNTYFELLVSKMALRKSIRSYPFLMTVPCDATQEWKDALETMACHAGVTSIGFAEDTYLGLLSFNVTNGVVLDIGRDRTQIVAYLNGVKVVSKVVDFGAFLVNHYVRCMEKEPDLAAETYANPIRHLDMLLNFEQPHIDDVYVEPMEFAIKKHLIPALEEVYLQLLQRAFDKVGAAEMQSLHLYAYGGILNDETFYGVLEDLLFSHLRPIQEKMLKLFQSWPDSLFSQLNDDILFRLSHYPLLQLHVRGDDVGERDQAPWHGARVLAEQHTAYYQSLFHEVKEKQLENSFTPRYRKRSL